VGFFAVFVSVAIGTLVGFFSGRLSDAKASLSFVLIGFGLEEQDRGEDNTSKL
jgi:ABC-type dipeptide/oligopeptide/nickel transport system permease subunit